ncbi:TetR/AcrR family transcriptional regulator [Brachybacterium squillarum]|uniref:TetR/AcrR family transcriptional regulator n=1 Tax=Brachybacterium squillarum TaxID=661979 RepID=UPI00026299DD|nr:TetR/AcrR family transcriptional regulator [Brachybacterium squillarum]
MGRLPRFETAAVVSSARELFWREGYEGASVSALQQATGLNSSSIYHAFGSKRGLFDAAIEDYLASVVRPGLARLRAEQVDPEAIVDYLATVRELVLDPAGHTLPDGCLLVNTACSGIARDPEVAAVVSAYRSELAESFGRGIAARFPEASAADREHLTRTCVASLVAALALTRVDGEAAAGFLESALALLRRPHPIA